MNDPIPRSTQLPDWLELVQKQVASMQHGTIHLIIHDSKVLQIETTEKVRFDKPEIRSRRIEQKFPPFCIFGDEAGSGQ